MTAIGIDLSKITRRKLHELLEFFQRAAQQMPDASYQRQIEAIKEELARRK